MELAYSIQRSIHFSQAGILDGVVRKSTAAPWSPTRPSSGVNLAVVRAGGGQRKAARQAGEGAALRSIS
jgi:hypothetical protein